MSSAATVQDLFDLISRAAPDRLVVAANADGSGINLTDEEDLVSGIAGSGTNVRTVLPPRTFMGTLKFNF